MLTKSRYMSGLQCLKRLWIEVNRRELIPEADAGLQHIFDEGHEVGELAKKFFPKGIDVPFDRNRFQENIEQTKELLKKRTVLFEAGIQAGQISARADVLKPVGKDEWDVIEVKSTTEVKDEHIDDVSFQKHCYEKAGLKIKNCFLMHLDKEYVKNGQINVKKIFKLEDITEKAKAAEEGIEERIDTMLKVMASKNYPGVNVGRQCKNPHACTIDDCWKNFPKNNVFDLYGRNKAEELLEMGILAIKHIPKGFKLSDKQQIQRECEINGKPHIHKEAIKHFLKTLSPPLYYLDFETINPAIPLYDGMHPYQRVPFQFSLHIMNKTTEHYSFLADGKEDPRPAFLKALETYVGSEGTIVAYNQSFETGVMKELAEAFPKHKNFLNSTIARVTDLLIPFRNFSYYHPDQEGSASIKDVLPAMTGRSHKELDISEGGTASLEYLRITFSKVSKKEKAKVRQNLEKYCALDTEGMVWIVEKLRELAG